MHEPNCHATGPAAVAEHRLVAWATYTTPSSDQAIIYYLMSPVFNWGKDKVGYYGAVSSASNGVGLCLLIPAFTLFGQ